MMLQLQCHDDTIRQGQSQVILDALWRPCERICRQFWGQVELRNRPGSFLRALLTLGGDFLGSTPPILEGLGQLLRRILEIFWSLLLI